MADLVIENVEMWDAVSAIALAEAAGLARLEDDAVIGREERDGIEHVKVAVRFTDRGRAVMESGLAKPRGAKLDREEQLLLSLAELLRRARVVRDDGNAYVAF